MSKGPRERIFTTKVRLTEAERVALEIEARRLDVTPTELLRRRGVPQLDAGPVEPLALATPVRQRA